MTYFCYATHCLPYTNVWWSHMNSRWDMAWKPSFFTKQDQRSKYRTQRPIFVMQQTTLHRCTHIQSLMRNVPETIFLQNRDQMSKYRSPWPGFVMWHTAFHRYTHIPSLMILHSVGEMLRKPWTDGCTDNVNTIYPPTSPKRGYKNYLLPWSLFEEIFENRWIILAWGHLEPIHSR